MAIPIYSQNESLSPYGVYRGRFRDLRGTRWSTEPNFPWERWSEDEGELRRCVIDVQDADEAVREIEIRISQLNAARDRVYRVIDQLRANQYPEPGLMPEGWWWFSSREELMSRERLQRAGEEMIAGMRRPIRRTPEDFTNKDEGGVV